MPQSYTPEFKKKIVRLHEEVTAQTVCDYSAVGRHLFNLCEKRSGRCFAYLVGVSDHRACRLPGGIWIFEENQNE